MWVFYVFFIPPENTNESPAASGVSLVDEIPTPIATVALPTITSTRHPINAGTSFQVKTQIRAKDGMAMVYVSEGKFMMGNEDGLDDEKFVHQVIVNKLWLDKTEVTVGMFRHFVEKENHETITEKEGWGLIYEDGEWRKIEGASWLHPDGSNSEAQNHHPVVQSKLV